MATKILVGLVVALLGTGLGVYVAFGDAAPPVAGPPAVQPSSEGGCCCCCDDETAAGGDEASACSSDAAAACIGGTALGRKPAAKPVPVSQGRVQ